MYEVQQFRFATRLVSQRARSLGVGTGPYATPVLEEFFPDATAEDFTSLGDIVKLLGSVP